MKMTPSWRLWARAAMRLCYPVAFCSGCRGLLTGPHALPGFCRQCHEETVRIRAPFCRRCSEPFPGDITADFTCPQCSGTEYAFECAVSPALSRGPVRHAIHAFKYAHQLQHRLPLVRLMRAGLHDTRLQGADWLLVPVPLHHRRRRERGFNQSAELAHKLARCTGRPYLNALRRTRYTSAQAGLDRAHRLKNLAGAFALRRKVKDRDVLLIDDVFTTGATAHACALVLKAGGARRVAVLTAARA
jgi:ComF family protein